MSRTHRRKLREAAGETAPKQEAEAPRVEIIEVPTVLQGQEVPSAFIDEVEADSVESEESVGTPSISVGPPPEAEEEDEDAQS